jgi:hypothetical protein
MVGMRLSFPFAQALRTLFDLPRFGAGRGRAHEWLEVSASCPLGPRGFPCTSRPNAHGHTRWDTARIGNLVHVLLPIPSPHHATFSSQPSRRPVEVYPSEST